MINNDLTLDVNGDVILCRQKITEFPFKFGVISGDFNYRDNKLESLKNSPNQINGSFNCFENKLTSLKGCLKEINGDFYCFNNKIVYLDIANSKKNNIIIYIGNNFDK